MKSYFLKSAMIVLGFSFVLTNSAFAEQMREQDRDIMEKAKGKKYRNGAEEGELRVQAQVIKPQRKVAPVIDKKATDNEESD